MAEYLDLLLDIFDFILCALEIYDFDSHCLLCSFVVSDRIVPSSATGGQAKEYVERVLRGCLEPVAMETRMKPMDQETKRGMGNRRDSIPHPLYTSPKDPLPMSMAEELGEMLRLWADPGCAFNIPMRSCFTYSSSGSALLPSYMFVMCL